MAGNPATPVRRVRRIRRRIEVCCSQPVATAGPGAPDEVGMGKAPARARPGGVPARQEQRFLTADHPVRDKMLWWLLYESAARAGEVLALDVADLDPLRRRAVVIGKAGRAELIGWETKTARLLPRLRHRQREGPLFLADIAPAPARQPALADLDPDSGRARLSYRRAAEVFNLASGGATLHHVAPAAALAADTLGRGRIALPILMAKSRHTNLNSLPIHAKPTFDAVAAATAAIDPDRRRH